MWFIRFFSRNKKKYKQLILLECQIHGSHYYECLKLIQEHKLFVGEPLTLQREPHNSYDPYAIEILTAAGKKLGYIPQKHSQVLASLMDHQCVLSADIQSIFTTAWEPININVTLLFPK